MKNLIPTSLFLSILMLSGCSGGDRPPGHLSPEKALESFQVHPDFRVEIFAAEPHVIDPVELVFDEDGRAFVAEMLDYPTDPPAGDSPRSRIRLLEDFDADGRIDHSRVFADDLLQVTSMLPWKGGLIVTSAPDILYLKDTNGNLRADLRQVLFTGFSMGNPESRITNLRFGIDNWIYASNNGQPGTITSPAFPEAPPVSVLGTDFRFRMDLGRFEAASGRGQFGLAIDDWGHRFITQNTIHVRHVVIPRRYLERNLFLARGNAVQDISDHGRPSVQVFQLTPPQYWRKARTQIRQRRFDELGVNRTEVASGYFTGASGGTLYTGDTFLEKYRGNLFTGDVAGNFVHRDVIFPDGPTFRAARAPEEQDREFLASTDPWFRPCNFTIGPDGNLYMVDIYREFIETPASIPEDLLKDMDMYSGDDLGRIYRIVRADAPPPRSVEPRLSEMATQLLVRLLEQENNWWRLTGHRLLIEKQDPSAIPVLKSLVQGDPPPVRVHALYVLDAYSALDQDLLETALGDPYPGVRENALQLAENYPALEGRLAKMVDDPSPRVALQLALSLGEFSGPESFKALVTLASRSGQDPWFRTAILSSERGSSARLLQEMLGEGNFFEVPDSEKEKFLEELAAVIGARNRAQEVGRMMNLLSRTRALQTEAWQVAGLNGLARGLELAGARRLKISGAEATLARLLRSSSEEVQAAALNLARHFTIPNLIANSSRQAQDADLPVARRKAAIQSLTGVGFTGVQNVFEQLLDSELDPELLKTAILSLGGFEEAGVRDVLISRWKRFGPEARNHALDVLLGHRARVPQLLEAIEGGQIEPAALDLPRREKLLHHPDAEVRDRAAPLFQQDDELSEGAEQWESYRSLLNLEGNSARGRPVFEEKCGTCHLPRKNKQVGPDLARVKGNTGTRLLQKILDPSRAIDPRYTNYIVVTADGRIHDGVIASETPGTLTLRSGEEEDDTVLRSNISSIRASSISLMPEGLEKEMSRQDLADVIAFLQGAGLHDH